MRRGQAELRKVAEAAAEKERVEADWWYCSTSTPQNPRTLSFLGATLSGRAPQSCRGSRREGASGGILAVLQHIHTSEPQHALLTCQAECQTAAEAEAAEQEKPLQADLNIELRL